MSIIHALLKLQARWFPLSRHTVRFIESMYKRGFIKGDVTAKTSFGALMKLDLTQFVQRFIYFTGAFDVNVLNLMESMNEENQFTVMVDVGANVGHHSLFAATKLKIPRIIAFEPVKETFNRLNSNIALNKLTPVIETFCNAVSDIETTVELIKPETHNDGMNYISESMTGSNEQVKTVVLDQYCSLNNITKIDLLKIDVEGAEVKVLNGLKEMMSHNRIGIIFIEICDLHFKRFNSSSVEAVSILENYGFTGFVIDGWELTALDNNHIPNYCDAVFVNDEVLSKMKRIGEKAGFRVTLNHL